MPGNPSLRRALRALAAREESGKGCFVFLRLLSNHQPDFIIHAAGRVGGIQANIQNPVSFLVENLDIGRNLILGAHKNGIKKLLNLGSSCMYPRNAPNPLKEEMVLGGELEPTNEGYALAKIVTQRLSRYINKEDSSFQYKTLIPCNLYGRHDKFDPKHSHLVPAIIHKMHTAVVSGQTQVDIWGDGTARREFMSASDLANCIYQAVIHFDKVPEMMNVGLGFDYTINQYYEAAAKVVGYKGQFVHDLSKPVGMKQKLVSIGKLEQFGWKSSVSLESGLKETYQFYLETQGK